MKTINLYQFSELSEDAQKNAIVQARNSRFKSECDYVNEMKFETMRKIGDAAKLSITTGFDYSIKNYRVKYLFSNGKNCEFPSWEEFCKTIEELECTNTIDYICKGVVRNYKKRKNANLKKTLMDVLSEVLGKTIEQVLEYENDAFILDYLTNNAVYFLTDGTVCDSEWAEKFILS